MYQFKSLLPASRFISFRMLRNMRANYLMLLMAILLSCVVYGQDSCFTKEQVQQDIIRLKNCDGAGCYELETKLMRSYIYNDSLFLSCMLTNQETFDQWLNSFSRIFTIYNWEDAIEKKLYFAYFSKFRELALSATQREYNNSKYGLMQNRIANKLFQTEIRFVE